MSRMEPRGYDKERCDELVGLILDKQAKLEEFVSEIGTLKAELTERIEDKEMREYVAARRIEVALKQ